MQRHQIDFLQERNRYAMSPPLIIKTNLVDTGYLVPDISVVDNNGITIGFGLANSTITKFSIATLREKFLVIEELPPDVAKWPTDVKILWYKYCLKMAKDRATRLVSKKKTVAGMIVFEDLNSTEQPSAYNIDNLYKNLIAKYFLHKAVFWGELLGMAAALAATKKSTSRGVVQRLNKRYWKKHGLLSSFVKPVMSKTPTWVQNFKKTCLNNVVIKPYNDNQPAFIKLSNLDSIEASACKREMSYVHAVNGGSNKRGTPFSNWYYKDGKHFKGAILEITRAWLYIKRANLKTIMVPWKEAGYNNRHGADCYYYQPLQTDELWAPVPFCWPLHSRVCTKEETRALSGSVNSKDVRFLEWVRESEGNHFRGCSEHSLNSSVSCRPCIKILYSRWHNG